VSIDPTIRTQQPAETFPVINPPSLKQHKVDDRITSTDATARLRALYIEMAEAAKDNPPLGDDLAWFVHVADVLRDESIDPQLRSDLHAVLLSKPPIGKAGDRFAEVFLAYTRRLLAGRCPAWCDDCLRDSGGTLHTGVVGTVTDKVNDAEPSTIVVRVERSDQDGKPGQAFVFLDAGSVELSPQGVANLGALLIEAAGIVAQDRAGVAL
jgi:hypothetical protein